jgi:hypothetical protein
MVRVPAVRPQWPHFWTIPAIPHIAPDLAQISLFAEAVHFEHTFPPDFLGFGVASVPLREEGVSAEVTPEETETLGTMNRGAKHVVGVTRGFLPSLAHVIWDVGALRLFTPNYSLNILVPIFIFAILAFRVAFSRNFFRCVRSIHRMTRLSIDGDFRPCSDDR